MDEPTIGLVARAAAIVMRAVKNVVQTGRTINRSIHRPSIHMFEAFDELILLKSGGGIIYCGPLGQNLSNVIGYFEVIIEIPYVCVQTIMFVAITYSMIGYYGSAYKIFWYFYAMLCMPLYYTYLGMLIASLTPNFKIVGILSSASSMFNPFSVLFVLQQVIAEQHFCKTRYKLSQKCRTTNLVCGVHLAAYSKVVGLVLSLNAYILDNKRYAYFPISRYTEGSSGIWPDKNSSRLLKRLFWLSP